MSARGKHSLTDDACGDEVQHGEPEMLQSGEGGGVINAHLGRM